MNSKLSFELGMPHLGRNNLSESALLKVIGHHRWMQIQNLGGVPSSQIRDEAGERLYATFFFIEVRFSQLVPLSAFGENRRLSFNSDLSHYEKVYLDGRYVVEEQPDHWVRCSNLSRTRSVKTFGFDTSNNGFQSHSSPGGEARLSGPLQRGSRQRRFLVS